MKNHRRARVLQKRIQHVIEQGEAAFGGFQALLDGGVDEALRDEACERRAQVIQGEGAALVQVSGRDAVFETQGVHHDFKGLFVARHGEALVAVGVFVVARRFLVRPRCAVFAAAANHAVARLFAVRAGADAEVVGEFRLFKDAGVGFQGDFAAVRQGA